MSKVTKTQKSGALTLEQFEILWKNLSEDVANAFCMSDDEKERFRNKNVARLIAAIPLLAGCENAERTAVAHLGTYILSLRETKHYFNANKDDDGSVFERLRLISNFKGGNKRIIKKGMSLLALNMLDDYKRDIHLDEAIGKYNPVGNKATGYESTRHELMQTIKNVRCPEMDSIYYDGGGAGTEAWWGL